MKTLGRSRSPVQSQLKRVSEDSRVASLEFDSQVDLTLRKMQLQVHSRGTVQQLCTVE